MQQILLTGWKIRSYPPSKLALSFFQTAIYTQLLLVMSFVALIHNGSAEFMDLR